MTLHLPRYIALCGNPGAGKSTVQEILRRDYGVTPVDDGLPIRKIAVEQMGLTWPQVTTQAGKLEEVEIAGRTWVVRDLLGQIGNRLEDLLGPHGIPFLVERTVAGREGKFSFGSVRRDQGRYYKKLGGVVIGVRSPKAPPSPYEFDRWDANLVDAWIDNDGENPRKLEDAVWFALGNISSFRSLFRDAA